eukprot:2619979-Prymnesium_polylepis.2
MQPLWLSRANVSIGASMCTYARGLVVQVWAVGAGKGDAAWMRKHTSKLRGAKSIRGQKSPARLHAFDGGEAREELVEDVVVALARGLLHDARLLQ